MRATPEETRLAILDAAAREFLQRGYVGSSLSAIAARIGLTKGALTYQFRTKDRILEEHVAHVLRAMQRADEAASLVFPERGVRACVAFLTGLGSEIQADPLVAAPMALLVDPSAPLQPLSVVMTDWGSRVAQFLEIAERAQGHALRMSPLEAAQFVVASLSGVWLATRYMPEMGHRSIRLGTLTLLFDAIGITDARRIVADATSAIEDSRVQMATDASDVVVRWTRPGGQRK